MNNLFFDNKELSIINNNHIHQNTSYYLVLHY